MVIPVGEERRGQRLVYVTKEEGKVQGRALEAVSFVDLVGTHGWGA